MEKKTVVSSPPSGLLKLAFRAPNALYRWHLGWLLGGRFVQLNHIGRKSGKLRHTVVEVAGHDPQTDTYYVVAAWGYTSNWYQNLQATPEITIKVGRRTLFVRAETLSPEDGAQVLMAYRQTHKLAARELSRIMGRDMISANEAELETMIRDSMPVVALRPRG
jgi:deazaflavin-dependent oxidoreductase (nitroreductase family)